eukprot:TRINITY_DN851_c1_g1_i1.p1 TRINITY_DN851_c1_g1~~TRINITY_DN851_c1_g1_i1.p1  ORF type:complete len:321 (+),score=39.25 TRINITY_DN851_c1_g1_i1:167-1129(+)
MGALTVFSVFFVFVSGTLIESSSNNFAINHKNKTLFVVSLEEESCVCPAFKTPGPLSAASANVSGAVLAASLVADSVTAGNQVVRGTATFTGSSTFGTATFGGAANFGGSSVTGNGNVGISGALTVNGAVSSGSVTISGALSANSATISGLLITTGNIMTAGGISANGLLTAGSINTNGALTAGSLGSGGDVVINRNVYAGGCSVSSTYNVRSIYTKTQANTQCGSAYTGSAAIMVPATYRGRTGTEICAADTASTGRRPTCRGTVFVYLTETNTWGYSSPGNVACSVPACQWWPWAHNAATPSSYDSDWTTDFFIVCCS